MESYNNILHKLSGFIKKYYTGQLIKGVFLFVALGMLFFIGLMSLEYFLWLNSNGRFILLLVGLLMTTFLLVKFLIVPLFYLFQLRKGLDPKQASRMIGDHFPEVGDRLLNLIDLAEDEQQSELLLASIEQRSQALVKVPFQKAIDLRTSWRFAKYLVVPAIIIVLMALAGQLGPFFGSYERVMNYDLAYERPAPFRFFILNESLEALEGNSYELLVQTVGEIRPEEVFIVIEGKERLLQQKNEVFSYTFNTPLRSAAFFLRANDVTSPNYHFQALEAPAIIQLETILSYPAYTERAPDTLLGTGNAIIPEGTVVTWSVTGKNAGTIDFRTADTIVPMDKRDQYFTLSKKLDTDLTYGLAVSNENVANYEALEYRLKVTKDESPTIVVKEVRDSLSGALFYEGSAKDDYRITKVELLYYEENEEDKEKKIILDQPVTDSYEFYYSFPSGVVLEEGKEYHYYFKVTDNDGLRGGKSTNSQMFSTSILTAEQEKERLLEYQQDLLKEGDRTLDTFKEQQESLNELNKAQKEKNTLSFNDQNEVRNFLKKQQQQELLMQQFSKQLKEAIKDSDKEDKMNQLLKERLERQEMEARKNEQLLEELKKLADKLEKEELTQRLEELGKKQQNSKRNLEQLLELTKRYYVREKANQLGRDLERLSEKQEVLSEVEIEDDFKDTEQGKINENFNEIKEQLNELRNDNKQLRKPLTINTDKAKEEEINKDLQDAREEINKQKGTDKAAEKEGDSDTQDKAKQKQRSAAAKMKQMGEDLQQSASGGGEASMAEDAAMLRQILDNLIIFSFKQEALIDRLKQQNGNGNYYANAVREEQALKSLFEHVDDSLFALSLRQVELTEFVNEQITEVYYNVEESLNSLTEGQIYQGVSYQQYVLTAANNLADFLANMLSNMQQSLAQGKGEGDKDNEFQLPDIIKGQQGISEKMGEGMKESGEGNKGKEGEKGEGGKEKGQEDQGKETGEGTKNGQSGRSQMGSGMDEEDMENLYEIYKQQQEIRSRLEQQLLDMINNEDKELAMKLAKQMEDFENDLLQNGITERTLNKANRIEQQLLKLENATLEQGKKEERESESNRKRYSGPLMKRPGETETEKGDVELLQRQALPLQKKYREKVRIYFRKDD